MFDNKWQKKEMPLVSLIGMGGGIASPAFLAAIVLNILKPTILSPEDDTGVPDFDYTAESSAITNVGVVPGGDSLSAPEDNFWRSVSYGDGKFVAISMNGTNQVMHSSDGINWSSASAPSGSWRSITYGNGKFVAVARSGSNYAMYSSDGINWSAASVPEQNSFDAVTYGNGKFVAVAYNGTNRVMYSSDGINWSSASAAQNIEWYSVAYGNGKFVAVGGTGTNYSSDGINWSSASPAEDNTWMSITYGNGIFVAVAQSGTNRVMYSSDGINWSSASAAEDNQWQSVTYGGDKFVAVAQNGTNRVMYSSDGENWAAASAEDNQWQSVTYGGDKFVAVAYYGPNHIMYSYNGTVWSGNLTELTLTDTTVSKVLDGSLVEGESIDQVLTVGETVQADTAISSTSAVSVFSTTLYNGNGQSRDLDTGIDNTDKSLIWFKKRGQHHPHILIDTVRGFNRLSSNNPQPGYSSGIDVTSFNDSGVSLTNATGWVNHPSGHEMVAWNFRAAPAFFDVVSWSGNDVNGRQISHNLGSAPGAIIIKNYSNTANWEFWHNSFDADDYMGFNSTSPKYETGGPWNNTLPTSEHFTVSSDMDVNRTGDNYVAYLFADTPGLIKCDSYTGSGDGTTVDCGFKPGWVLIKQATGGNNAWRIYDNKRGNGTHQCEIYPNHEYPEDCGLNPVNFTNTGFTLGYGNNTNAYPYIYIAIAENAEADITTDIYATGEVSESSGNAITLSNITGTWSTGMKVQGTDSDTKDNPSPISSDNVSLTSSAPTAERNVSTWGDAVWEIATDENFTQNVQTATTALSATGTQAGPSFVFEKETGYYARTKYTALGQESEWSDVTYFVTAPSVYVDDVFSTNLYTGNGSSTSSTQTINNGIDISGEGGLVWIKNRDATTFHQLFDTERGAGHYIKSNNNTQSQSGNHSLSSFNSNGFTLSWNPGVNGDGQNHVAWTFRKAPGFLDIVTYTGNSTAGHTISHSLGSVPGMIMIKNTSNAEQWQVWHRSVTGNLELDNTGAANTSSVRVDSVTSTSFNLTSGWNTSNADGQTYVAYIFAHDDARFGANGDESIIKCGSITTSSGEIPDVNLGFEPQFLLIKNTSTSANWYLYDSMRGMPVGSPLLWGNEETLYANLSNAAVTGANTVELTSTGFTGGPDNLASGTETLIYMAIRRPHKPATVVSDVFAIDTKSAVSGNTPQYTSNFPVDFAIRRNNITSQDSPEFVARLTNGLQYTNKTDSEYSGGTSFLEAFAHNNGWANLTNADSNDYLWMFKRSPGFMDVVTYSGTSSVRTVDHNLGVAPELLIVKSRSTPSHWAVYNATSGASKALLLSGTISEWTIDYWNNTAPTATQFTVGTDGTVNSNGNDYVAYLFATQPGISKVGSYVGNGPNGAQQVDCGFTNGAAFILVKNASSSSDWYLLDSERGINAYNETEPYIRLNTREYGQANMLGHHNVGFMVAGQYGSPLNNAGETYIFLAIANP